MCVSYMAVNFRLRTDKKYIKKYVSDVKTRK